MEHIMNCLNIETETMKILLKIDFCVENKCNSCKNYFCLLQKKINIIAEILKEIGVSAPSTEHVTRLLRSELTSKSAKSLYGC